MAVLRPPKPQVEVRLLPAAPAATVLYELSGVTAELSHRPRLATCNLFRHHRIYSNFTLVYRFLGG